MCSRDTVASSTWCNPQNECQRIDTFYSQFAASICCHRGRHHCNTVIHACLNGLILFILCLQRRYAATATVTTATQSSMPVSNLYEISKGRFELLHPSAWGTPSPIKHIVKDCYCGEAHYLMHLLTTVAWCSTWSLIISGLHNHTNTARSSQSALLQAEYAVYSSGESGGGGGEENGKERI